MVNDEKIVFEGEGDAVSNAIPGDVIVVIKVSRDSRFRRDGDDLFTKIDITFEEAILGFN